MSSLARWLLALAGGVAWGSCFAPRAWLVTPFLALIPLLLLMGQRRPAWSGWLHGLAFWVVSIPWIVPTLQNHGQLPTWLAIVSFLGLASYLALFTALFAWAGAPVWRRGGSIALLGLPALWVTVEWIRGWLFTGFPWNLAGYAWIDLPGALALSAWSGPHGVAFLLVLCNVALGRCLVERRWRSGVAVVGLVLVILAVAARWAVPAVDGGKQPEGVPVRVLQPDIGILTEWDEAVVEAQYQRMFELSRQACDRPGALIIWPESGAWPYSYSKHARLREDLQELARQGCDLLVNTSMTGDGGIYNSVLLVDQGGAYDRYDKQHLVPFGEYVPLARWLPFLEKIARHAGAFLTGSGLELLQWREEELAPAICFEITFPAEVAERVRGGGTILVTVTNDAWYGDSWAPWQHYRAARFRAAENRRYLLRAAITGVSAIVGPDGAALQQLDVGDAGILAARIPGRTDRSPYTRWPWLVPVLCIGLSGFAIFLCRRETQT